MLKLGMMKYDNKPFAFYKTVLRNGNTLILTRASFLAKNTRIAFRGYNVQKAGNFSRWESLKEFLRDPSVLPGFTRIIAEMIEQETIRNVIRFTMQFPHIVGWSPTVPVSVVQETHGELRKINNKAVAYFITDQAIKAPATHSVNVVCRVTQDKPGHWVIIVCHISPGPSPGELRGNITANTQLCFFDPEHPGEIHNNC